MTDPKPASSDTLVGSATILMTLAGWTAVPLFLEHFSHLIDAWTSNGWRYGFAALLWSPVVLAGLFHKRLPKGLWKVTLVPGLVNSLGQVCFTWAHYKIEPGLLTFGLRIQIICVAIGAALLFPNERRIIRTKSFMVGLVMVLVGTLGTISTGDAIATDQSVFGVGLAILSGVMFAAYSISVRYFLHAVHPIVAFAVISQYTAGLMLLLMLFLGENAGAAAVRLPPVQFYLLLLSSVVGIALGHVCYYIAIARLGVAVSAGVIQLQPFAVGAFSVVLFHERLTPFQWAAGGVAVLGAALVLWVQHRLTRKDRAAIAEATPEEYRDLPADHMVAAVGEAASGDPVPAGERETDER